MALEEKDYYALLGLDAPSQQPEAVDPESSKAGENGQGVAAPDGAGYQTAGNPSTAAGDRKTDSSAPPQNDKRENWKTDSSASLPSAQNDKREDGGADDDEQKDGDGKGTMSREERARQARLRRERETQATVDAAVRKAEEALRKKHEDDMKALFQSAGMVDRYHDNKPITTMEEFAAFQEARQADKLARELQGGRLTPESLQTAIDNSQAVKDAKAAVARLEAKESAEKQAADKAAFEQQMARELEQIHALDPGVKTLEDALALETGPEFSRLVTERGLSFLEAFKLANIDRITAARSMAAAQGAATAQMGKAHLRSVVRTGDVPVDVPQEIVRNYRLFQPDMSLEEIRRDWQKRQKG